MSIDQLWSSTGVTLGKLKFVGQNSQIIMCLGVGRTCYTTHLWYAHMQPQAPPPNFRTPCQPADLALILILPTNATNITKINGMTVVLDVSLNVFGKEFYEVGISRTIHEKGITVDLSFDQT